MATKRCPYCAEEIQDEAIKCKHCLTWLAAPPPGLAPPPAHGADPYFGEPAPGGSGRRFTRSTTDAMLAGVLGGLARWMGVDALWLRIGYAIGTVFTGVIPGVVIYIVLALLVPGETTGKGII